MQGAIIHLFDPGDDSFYSFISHFHRVKIKEIKIMPEAATHLYQVFNSGKAQTYNHIQKESF